MSKYQLVKMHDRVGRMADTWEYSHVTLPRARCAPELIDELRADCAASVEIGEHTVVLRHVYIERRMTPLNIYLAHATDAELEAAVREYGNAIKELAAANIFAGDMLFKNFGVTRLDRVVFYDYDEIEYRTDCNFRRVPPPPDEQAELWDEPWYRIDKGDVFPENWTPFLLGNPRIRAALLKYHADLFTPEFWGAIQARVAAGQASSARKS